jgi:hypothetical protein
VRCPLGGSASPSAPIRPSSPMETGLSGVDAGQPLSDRIVDDHRSTTRDRARRRIRAQSSPADPALSLASEEVRGSFRVLDAAAREVVRVSEEDPLPTSEVYDAASDKYSEAYRHLLPAIRRELAAVPREPDT